MKIVGFGACMIKGYGISPEFSFLNQLKKYLDLTNDNLESVISLEGFPINRAKKYVNTRVLRLNPDLVIVQFGSTDINVKLKDGINKILKKEIFNIDKLQPRKTTLTHLQLTSKQKVLRKLKYPLKFLLFSVLNIKPRTPREIYVSSMEEIITNLIANNIKPVILSPFIQLDPYTNFIGRKYAKDIKILQSKYDFIYVDCISELNKHNIEDVLLSDGFHLSVKGHKIISDAIWEELKLYINKNK